MSATPRHSAPVLVVGMHRSGTSLLARILSDLGVHMGLELDVHHEAVLMKEINNELLALVGAHWAKPGPFDAALGDGDFVERCQGVVRERLRGGFSRFADPGMPGRWGFKDPRNTLTLPVWLRCFPASRVIHIVRHGVDVALSVFRRETRRWVNRSTERRMFPPTPGVSYRLWRFYVDRGLAHTRQLQHLLFLRYEDLLEGAESQLVRIQDFLELERDQPTVRRIARDRIRRPRPRSRWAFLWLRFLLRTGRLDRGPLVELGYAP